jgi:hypothetical protein
MGLNHKSMEFSNIVVEKVRRHEEIREEFGRIMDAISEKVRRAAVAIEQFPAQKDRFEEVGKYIEALIREMAIGGHKAEVIKAEMYKERPDEVAMANAMDRAIVIVERMCSDAAKYNAALDEILTACGQKP